jgi:lipoprotein-releasing system ATP-binding protein
VLLADEPTGSLDHRTADTIMTLIEDLHRQRKLTSVLVTHNLAFAQRCDRILSLQMGRLEPFLPGARPTSIESVPYTGNIGSSYV